MGRVFIIVTALITLLSGVSHAFKTIQPGIDSNRQPYLTGKCDNGSTYYVVKTYEKIGYSYKGIGPAGMAYGYSDIETIKKVCGEKSGGN